MLSSVYQMQQTQCAVQGQQQHGQGQLGQAPPPQVSQKYVSNEYWTIKYMWQSKYISCIFGLINSHC